MDAKTVKGLIKQGLGGVRQAFRGTIKNTNVATENQTVSGEGLDGEALPDLEHLQHYGQASRAPDGKQSIAIPLGGKTSHAVIVAVQGDQVMVGKLAPGEAIQYSSGGGFIHSKADGNHYVKGDLHVDGKVVVTQSVEAGTDVVAKNDVKDNGGMHSMSAMRETFDLHGHNETDGVTQPPNQKMG